VAAVAATKAEAVQQVQAVAEPEVQIQIHQLLVVQILVAVEEAVTVLHQIVVKQVVQVL
jgi:hypothetical protein